MEEINFGDEIVHYNNKIQEIIDIIDELRINIKTTQEIAVVGWKGRASESFQDKMILLARDLISCATNISDARHSLVGIGNAYEEELVLNNAEV